MAEITQAYLRRWFSEVRTLETLERMCAKLRGETNEMTARILGQLKQGSKVTKEPGCLNVEHDPKTGRITLYESPWLPSPRTVKGPLVYTVKKHPETGSVVFQPQFSKEDAAKRTKAVHRKMLMEMDDKQAARDAKAKGREAMTVKQRAAQLHHAAMELAREMERHGVPESDAWYVHVTDALGVLRDVAIRAAAVRPWSAATNKPLSLALDEAQRPTDDKDPPLTDLTFMECDTCRAKPGSPTLCAGCVHNRRVIGALTKGRTR